MILNVLAAAQAASTAPAPQPTLQQGWLDPLFVGFVAAVGAQLVLIAWVLLVPCDENEKEESPTRDAHP